MSDITTAELDTTVQATLTDWRVSPFKRAKIAVENIEAFARKEAGIDEAVPLPVPLEWEHRVAGMADAGGVHDVIEGVVISDSDDEKEEQEKINRFWSWGR